KKLKPGGLLFISHSETLNRVTDVLEMVQPSIYIKK
ncbi:MAG: chemotaxis methyl-accepting protein methylase, partial [Cognaticolwellia sp.]